MKYCTQCGKAMDEAYQNCPYCGTKADIQEPETNNTQFNQEPCGSTFAYGAPGTENAYTQQPPRQGDIPEYIPAPIPQRSAYVAAFLALFFGIFGLHDFYLDRTTKGIIKLLVSVLGCGIGAVIIEIISIIDALRLLKGEINVDGRGEMIKPGF